MPPTRHLLSLFCVATCVKVLLVPAYRSTDFEVHRNWLAVTGSLPPSEWYTEATSEWTLDYPPGFAWFERALHGAALAAGVEPQALAVHAQGYASPAIVAFQRGSVMATDLALVGGAALLVPRGRGGPRAWAPAALVLLSPGLLLVDHIHFQYNGLLLGWLLASLGCLARGSPGGDAAGALLFAGLLSMKHLFLALAPFFFVHLLRQRCVGASGAPQPRGLAWLAAFAGLAALGVAAPTLPVVFAAGTTPADQLRAIAARLFPFDRGLCHAYWAPNVWALYAFADRVAAAALKAAGRAAPKAAAGVASSASGLVGVTAFQVLPAVPPAVTALLTLASMLPALRAVWAARDARARAALAPSAAAHCALCTFMLGYHVHEKALLVPLVPLAALACRSAPDAALYLRVSAVAHAALLPLFTHPRELVPKVALVATHAALAPGLLRHALGVRRLGTEGRRDQWAGFALAAAAVLNEAAALVRSGNGGALPGRWAKVEFLPLMAVSVSAGVLLLPCWWGSWRRVAEAGGGKRE